MKTEAATFTTLAAPRVVSRALQDLAPYACSILDSKGNPVSLSLAGYVLHAGRKYRLRIVPPPDNDLLDFQIVNEPDFLELGKQLAAVDELGRRVCDVPFRVRRDLGAAVYRIGNLRAESLEIHFTFTPASGKHAPSYYCPVVVRPGASLLFVALLTTLLSTLAPVAVTVLSRGGAASGNFSETLGEWLTDPRLWIVFAALLLLLLAVYGWTLWQLYQRSRDLRREFREAYPNPIANEE